MLNYLLIDYKDIVKTITADNGKEFAYHKVVSEVLDCDYYFAHPYASYERGLNENTNGLIRQYAPKGSSFEKIDENKTIFMMDRLNNRPRKTLGFKTPKEVFFEKIKQEMYFKNETVALAT